MTHDEAKVAIYTAALFALFESHPDKDALREAFEMRVAQALQGSTDPEFVRSQQRWAHLLRMMLQEEPQRMRASG